MSEDTPVYGEPGSPAVLRTNEMRALIAKLGWSQRETADVLEFESRSVRRWASSGPPQCVIFALRYLASLAPADLAELVRGVRGSSYATAAVAGSANDIVPRTGAQQNVVHKRFASDEDDSSSS